MSNAMQRDLAKLVGAVESAEAGAQRRWAQHFHLMPPVGWLNDPNGLHERDGVFHAYFQYAPFDVNGGVKMWGHSTSRDLLSWTYEGCVLMPDEPFDCHGVYSGSALVLDDRVEMFYTGNVKLPGADGAYDYVNTGREGNTVAVSTPDGSAFAEKRLLMTNADYPEDLTCHVRDPKVWRADAAQGRYLMVQGARRRVAGSCADAAAPEAVASEDATASEAAACEQGSARRDLLERCHGKSSAYDQGEILVFASDDLEHWTLVNRVSTPERFGFMWECPDYFELPIGGVAAGSGVGTGAAPLTDGALARPLPAAEQAREARIQVLSVSPQGLLGDEWERRNVYQSGYFTLEGDLCGECELGDFRLWDAGFDFYAPQTFEAQDGRRIMIGWMGMPDEPSYGNDPTVAEGWQHCFTVPRELWVNEAGRVCQAPVREVAQSRGAGTQGSGTLTVDELAEACDITVDGVAQSLHMVFGEELEIAWNPAADGSAGRFEMRFTDPSRTAAGCGRSVRWEHVERVQSVRVLVDTSSVEVFVNDGELVMSTRWYPQRRSCSCSAPGADIRCWDLVCGE
ncbi:MAG: glycoside hydrolase family 32 protein [Coriobacteriaceae bacterium]|nr:glycoside hydrolase family 32 protein [Coriobacteriaceae bacterium]